MKDWYAQILVSLYKENRKNVRWDLLYECHDQEDRDYFDMLDQQLEKLKGEKHD